jgi:hypothetical protein
MKRVLLLFVFLSTITFAQSNWNLIWKLSQKPFMDPQIGSEMAIVKAGFDTDQDGWGEFLCAWTDLDKNFILMYEASADNTYDLVWYWQYPVAANSFAGIAVGDIDNNGKVDIITTMPSVANTESPNPPRLWVFEWQGVVGENNYGTGTGDAVTPTADWNYELPDNTDFRPYSLIVEDIDHDGKNELITGVRSGDRGREILVASVEGELSGFGFWQIEFNFAQAFGGSVYNVTTGDMDHDGNQELYMFVWDLFTMRIFECMGDQNYQEVFAVDNLYSTQAIDYGSLEGVRVADVDGNGKNEMYIAGTEPTNTVFVVDETDDISTLTSANIHELLSFPVTGIGKLRTLNIGDPDGDGNMSLLIGGEGNGQIFEVEYKGSGSPIDSANWEWKAIFDVWEYSGISPTTSPTLTPRYFYGSYANDMDKDGKPEYLFVNYSTDFSVWSDDAYVWMLEVDNANSVRGDNNLIPDKLELNQNYPNPFNPSTTIKFGLPEAQFVTINIYDVLGNKLQTVVNENLQAGTYTYNFDASKYPSGIYFYSLTTNNSTITKKMMLIK